MKGLISEKNKTCGAMTLGEKNTKISYLIHEKIFPFLSVKGSAVFFLNRAEKI